MEPEEVDEPVEEPDPQSPTYDRVYRSIDRLATAMPGRIGKDIGTWGGVFDTPTVMTLHKFLRNDVLKSLDYPISEGKEAGVFKATSGDGDAVAVKVYRVHTATFRQMTTYIEGDPRFRKVPRDHRELVYAWAKKEYRNLERYRDAGVDVPTPVRCLNNTVVMEFLGTEEGPARTMKDQPPPDPEAAFDKLWGDYRRLLDEARSIHADFSEFNVLMDQGRPRIIDVGQGVLDAHPMAQEFLARDVRNICRFFRKFKVAGADEAARLGEARAIVKTNESKELDVEEL